MSGDSFDLASVITTVVLLMVGFFSNVLLEFVKSVINKSTVKDERLRNYYAEVYQDARGLIVDYINKSDEFESELTRFEAIANMGMKADVDKARDLSNELYESFRVLNLIINNEKLEAISNEQHRELEVIFRKLIGNDFKDLNERFLLVIRKNAEFKVESKYYLDNLRRKIYGVTTEGL